MPFPEKQGRAHSGIKAKLESDFGRLVYLGSGEGRPALIQASGMRLGGDIMFKTEAGAKQTSPARRIWGLVGL